jgi:riboflavin kinase/FMN adenylyltransferase
MLSLRGFDETSAARGGFLSIGNFDGVHRGHQAILNTLVAQARREGAPAVVLTFDPHPIQLLAPDRAPPALTTLPRKSELIERCGVDVLIVVETTRTLLDWTPEEFFERIVIDTLQARGLVEGPNFCFGRGRTGDITRLEELCRQSGRSLAVVAPITVPGATVSSSAIRLAISRGRLAEAATMLGRPYQVEGLVAAGAARGEALGFPTANLTGVSTLLPPDGVYAGLVELPREVDAASVGGSPRSPDCRMQHYPAAVHLGPNPTFSEAHRKLEVHLVGFQGNLYGRSLRVDLMDRIRDIQRFQTREALQQQLQQDIAQIVERVRPWMPEGQTHGQG